MPNWCENDLTITGSANELNRFIAAVEEIQDDETFKYQIIAKLFPLPKELEGIISPCTVVPDEDPLLGERDEFFSSALSGYRRYISETENKHLIETYGANNWYDWQHVHWGVKWGDCHTELGTLNLDYKDYSEIQFHFDTPWGPPDKAFIEISKQWPTLTFEDEYFEGGMGFSGGWIIHNGEMSDEWSSDYRGSRGG